MSNLPRRTLMRRVIQLTAGATIARSLVPIAMAGGSCVDTGSEALRVSMKYVAAAADPAQACATCAFFTADESKAGCGGCQIMGGPVDATGHCESWSARS